jgi:hypothetical protein
LLERLRMLGVSTLNDLLRAQRGLMPGDPEPNAPAALLTALREWRLLKHYVSHSGGEPISRTILLFGAATPAWHASADRVLLFAQRTAHLLPGSIGELTLVEE